MAAKTIDRSRQLLQYNASIYPQNYAFKGKKREVNEEQLLTEFTDALKDTIDKNLDVYKQYAKKQKWEVESISYTIQPNNYYVIMTIKYWESEEQWSKRIKAAEAAQKAVQTRKVRERKKELETLQKLLTKHNIKSIDDVNIELSRSGELLSEVQEG